MPDAAQNSKSPDLTTSPIVPPADTPVPAEPRYGVREPDEIRWESPFEFTGDGAEYFRIWVVNLLLTLVTFGVYSAWAKVRKTRYFWQNTRLAGHVFDFHGRPAAILRGRILALALLLAYTWSFEFSLIAGIVTISVLCVLTPWLFLKAQQFRLYNTSHRGLRFGFPARLGDAYRMALPLLLLWGGFIVSAAAFTALEDKRFAAALMIFPVLIVVLLPSLHHRLKAFQHRNATWGNQMFSFDSAIAGFYKTYLKALAVAAVSMLAMIVVGVGLVLALSRWHANPTTVGVVFGLLGSAIYIFLWPYMSVRLQQVVWRHTLCEGVRFDTAIRVWPLVRLVARTVALTIATAGLYWPFAAVALARYRITSMRMSPSAPLASVVALEDIRTRTALGDAATDTFGFDIGL